MMKDFTNHVLKKHKKILIIFTVEWSCMIICGIVSFLYMGTWIQNMINQSLGGFPIKIENEISLLISYSFAIFKV